MAAEEAVVAEQDEEVDKMGTIIKAIFYLALIVVLLTPGGLEEGKLDGLDIFQYICLGTLVLWIVLIIVPGLTGKKETENTLSNVENSQEPLDLEADQLEADIRRFCETIDATTKSIEDEQVATVCKSIVKHLKFVEEDVKKDPKDRKKIRKFVNQMMPMIEELVVKYKDVEGQKETVASASKTMKDIEKALGKVDIALVELLEDLFANDSLEINANIDALDKLFSTEDSRIKIDFDKLEK